MAEVAHTCINTSPWDGPIAPCPGCQAHGEKLFQKEREALAVLFRFTQTDSVEDYDTLVRVGREWAELYKQSGRKF